MRKHILSILVCLSMLLIMLPMTAFAADPVVTISGVAVDTSTDWYATTNTDGNVTACESTDDWNIHVVMDNSSGTDTAEVTLNNAIINNFSHAIETTDCDLHIILDGTSNKIGTNSTDTGRYAISPNGKNVTIDGDGNLSIKGNYGIEVNGSGNVSIDITGSLNIDSYWQGVQTSGDLDISAESIDIEGYYINCGSVSLNATDGDISVIGSGDSAIQASSGNVSVSAPNGAVTLTGDSYAVKNDNYKVDISAGNDVKLKGSIYGSEVYVRSDNGDVTINGHCQAIEHVSSSATISAPEGDITLTADNYSNIISGSNYTLDITAGGMLTAEGPYGIASFGNATIKAGFVIIRNNDNGVGLQGGTINITNPDGGNCSLVNIYGGAGTFDLINVCDITIKSDLVKIIAADDVGYAINATGEVRIDDAGVIVGSMSIPDGSDFINTNVIRADVYGSNASGGLNLADATPTVTTYYDAGNGYAVWKPDSKTLILHNAKINNVDEPSSGSALQGINLPSGNITIVVEGDNEIQSAYGNGIGNFDTDVTFDGDGTLNVDGYSWGISLGCSSDGGSLTFAPGSSVTLNGKVYIYDGTTQNFCIYGNETIDSDTYWSGFTTIAATIADGAVLTITEDGSLWLDEASSITNNGQIVNNGTIILPYDYTVSDIEALNITGDGMIQLYNMVTDDYKIYIDGNIYDYLSGPSLNLFSPVPTEVTYYEAGDGYAIFTPADSTLILHNVDSNPNIALPGIPITMVLEGENEVNQIIAHSAVTVDGSGTLNALNIDCTSEGAALNVNSGATLNTMVTTTLDGVTTVNIYGRYSFDDDMYFQNNVKLALMPNSVLTLNSGVDLVFFEGTTLNDMTFGEDSKIVNNGTMILPMGTTSEQIAELPLSGAGVVYIATNYLAGGIPNYNHDNPYTNDGVPLTKLIGELTLDNNEVTADDNAGYTWLKTGSGDDEVWTLTLANVCIDGNLNLPDGTIVINTTADSVIKRDISLGSSNACDLTFTGSGRLGINGNVWSGQGGEVTIDEGADVTISNGLNVGTSGGVNGALTVNGTLSASSQYDAAINTGSLEIGSKGILNVTGVLGMKLNGMNPGEGIVYDDAFVIKDGGALYADCTDANIEVFTNNTEATEDAADDVIVIPDGYMPDGYLIKIVSGENGGIQYAYTIAKTNQEPTLESERVLGAGGTLTLIKPSNNNDNDHHSNSGGGDVLYVLTFDTNGGSKISKVYKKYGTVIDLSDYEPKYDGFDFDGWYSDEKLTDNVTSVKLKGNTTVYAKWTEKTGETTDTKDTTEVVNPFIDVTNGDYFHDAVLWAVEKGITSGTTSNLFSPNMVCTRAQTVTLLWKAMGSPEPASTDCIFTDVAKDAYYYKAVLWAVENGIAAGTSSTTFSPDSSVSRAQAVTFMWRAEGKPVVNCVNPFTDVTGNDYYYDAIMWAVEKNITQGSGTSTFSPNNCCTRAQIVSFLYRAKL